MGAILIDGQPVEFELPAGATVESAFEVVRNEILGQRRIVAEVSVDDVDVVWGDGSELWSIPFADSSVLSVHTDAALRMTSALLERAMEVLPELANRHRQAAEALRVGDIEGGINSTLEATPWWEEITAVCDNAGLLHGIDFASDEWKPTGDTIASAVERLREQLGEFREAAEAQDYVLLADLLEYELAPMADEWQTICARFLQLLQERFSMEGDQAP